MRNAYEVMYIIPVMEAEAVEKIINKYNELLVNNGATILSTDNWGKKRLAYEINDLFEGIYVLVTFKSNPDAVRELDRVMHIDETILRHMIIRKEIR